MKSKTCYVFLFDGYADWEPALILATLNKYSVFSIYPFSVTGNSMQSMGGLQIQPTCSMKEINPDSADLILLPGGDVWENGGNEEISPLLLEMSLRRKTIAAICGATILLAKLGLLDTISHTSNGLAYLEKLAHPYKGEKHYIHEPCVTDGNIITANGAAMIEFTISIIKKFEVADSKMREKIYDLYKSGG